MFGLLEGVVEHCSKMKEQINHNYKKVKMYDEYFNKYKEIQNCLDKFK